MKKKRPKNARNQSTIRKIQDRLNCMERTRTPQRSMICPINQNAGLRKENLETQQYMYFFYCTSSNNSPKWNTSYSLVLKMARTLSRYSRTNGRCPKCLFMMAWNVDSASKNPHVKVHPNVIGQAQVFIE